MALYETVLIVRQDLSATQNDALVKEMTDIVTDKGGKVKNSEYWGLRNLAYRINKNRKGHYTMLHIDGPAEAKNELERKLRLNDDVLRFMTIAIDEIPSEPSVMMRNKQQGEAA